MTISKKMLIAGFFAVSAQFGIFAYDAVGLKNEINAIVDFADKYSTCISGSEEAQDISFWLRSKVADSYADDMFILGLARVIMTISMNDDQKVAALLKIMYESEIVRLNEEIKKAGSQCLVAYEQDYVHRLEEKIRQLEQALGDKCIQVISVKTGPIVGVKKSVWRKVTMFIPPVHDVAKATAQMVGVLVAIPLVFTYFNAADDFSKYAYVGLKDYFLKSA